MATIDTILPGGRTAVLIGTAEGLRTKLHERYTSVIVENPSHNFEKTGHSSLSTDIVGKLHGSDQAPESQQPEIDCLVLSFGISTVDDPVKEVTRWASRLSNGGRLVALEWAALPHIEPGADANLHAQLLSVLEDKTDWHRLTGQQLVQVLQKSGLSHVRQQQTNATDWLDEEDIASLTTEMINTLSSLGGDADALVKEVRKRAMRPVPLAVAYGTHKTILPVKKAREIANKTQEVADESKLPVPSDAGLRDLLTTQLLDLVEDPAETADILLTTFGARALGALSDASLLSEVTGMSKAAARKFLGLLALGRRLNRPHASGINEVHGPEDAYRHLGSQMGSLTREHFRGLYLDVKGRIVADEIISIGTLTSALVHPREVYGTAIERHCHSLLIAHNHPSGDPLPSPEDIQITRELAEAGRLLGIELLDHIIIGHDGYISMKERNYY